MSKALTLKQVDGKPGEVYYPLSLDIVPDPSPQPTELKIQIHTAALNHRDYFQRQHMYPGTTFLVPLLADGCGIVTAVGSSASSSWNGKRVILSPGWGWESSTEGPSRNSPYSILGGTKFNSVGTAQDVVCVPEHEVEEAPEHLSDAEAAALPLCGLTAWRALMVKSGNAEAGRNILVTGIGGGVALNVLQFAVAKGCNVYVTSGSDAKIAKAKMLGAKGGAIYKEVNWEKDILKQLPKERPEFDAIVDGAGGEIVVKGVRLLKHGGIIACYGMTTKPTMNWPMSAVMKNIELKGCMMGSRAEFRDMIQFVKAHQIKPIISRIVKGLDNLNGIEGLFEEMQKGSQYGKLVIEIAPAGPKASSKL